MAFLALIPAAAAAASATATAATATTTAVAVASAVAAAASVAGGVVSMMAQQQQAAAQEKTSKYNAAVSKQNAQITQAQGSAAAELQQRDAQRRIGSMVAAYGASGIQGGSGSPVDVLSDSVRQSTLDNLTTKYNYTLKARGYTNQAQLDKAEAANASTAGTLGMIGSGLSLAGKMGAMYASYGGTDVPGYGGVYEGGGNGGTGTSSVTGTRGGGT